jgi:hypothetical protein
MIFPDRVVPSKNLFIIKNTLRLKKQFILKNLLQELGIVLSDYSTGEK